MADIRINSLPSTATSFNTDDYIAIDGASGGTRKMLAATLPLTDVTLGGASGPSVKSSLSARAPRQGLVFDGTANATGTVAAFGATDFSVFTWVNVTSFASARSIIGGGTGAFVFSVNTSGALVVGKYGSADLAVSTSTLTAGKNTLVGYVRSGTTGTYYINGIAAGTTSDSYNYTAAISQIGANGGGSSIFLGVIDPIYPYNRALSASEVVALYEAGAPAGADYPAQVAGTALITGNNSTFAGAGNWTNWGSGSITVSSGVGNFSAGGTLVGAAYAAAYLNVASTVRALVRYRISADVTAISSGNIVVMNGVDGALIGTLSSTTGTGKTLEFTAPSNANGLFGLGSSVSGATFTLDNVTLVAVGLLLAPDAAQAGGGLVWYDTSGNAANITLPASGVSWNVPFGNNIAASGTNQNITLTPSGTGSVLAHDTNAFYRNTNSGSDTATKLKVKTASNAFLAIDGGAATSGVSFGIYNSSSNPVRQSAIVGIASNTTAGSEAGYLSFFTQTGGSSLTERGRFTETGNYLIGTTTDGGQKLQVSGTGTFSNTSASTPTIALNTTQTSTGLSFLSAISGAPSSERNWAILTNASAYGDFVIRVSNAQGGNPITAGTTALTLDSSQNATFAGNVTASGQIKSTFTSDYCLYAAPSSGANRNIAIFGVSGATNGFTIKWDNASATMRVNIQNLPTSATGLAAGDLYNSAGTLKIA